MKTKKWIVILAAFFVALSSTPLLAGESLAKQPRLLIIPSLKNDVSPPLRNLQPSLPSTEPRIREIPLLRLPPALGPVQPEEDPVIQDWQRTFRGPGGTQPTILQNFEGLSNADNGAVTGFLVVPPDTEGAVGPNHYVQWVNISIAVWDKTGTRIAGPIPGNLLWRGFGGPCETTNDGDPIVLYDHLADRWFLSQFANVSNGPPFFHCIAVSQTGDPTGSYNRYAFEVPNNKLGDYPKFGVWPDGYYMSVNQFKCLIPPPFCQLLGAFGFAGAGVAALERDKMLDGLPALVIYFDLEPVNPNFGGLLPADLDGPPPPTGTPNFFVAMNDNPDQLNIWEFHADFATPSNSTFGLSGLPNTTLSTAPFDSNLCNFNRECIPQRGTGQRLDAISDRLMYRLQFRDFGDHQAMVTNHTVDAGNDRAGIRWYELRDSGSGWTIFQQGTYAPDEHHRWMGSIAMDKDQNIALGYSVSSSSFFPSIRYAGREPTDPLGTLPQGEISIMSGGGSQTGAERWGDYSAMMIDPTDDCTFWYTQEYYAQTGGSGIDWRTRIASFRFPSCGPGGLVLTQDPLIRGQTTQFQVTGALPGEQVLFLFNLTGTGSGPCVPLLGGLCLDLLLPIRLLGSAPADASGTATLTRPIPPTAPAGVAISTQAVVKRGPGGADSQKSNFITDSIQ